MSIIKLDSGSYQAKLAIEAGRQVSRVFPTKQLAQEQLARWKREKREGISYSVHRPPSLDEYFAEWYGDVSREMIKDHETGWRKMQYQQYCRFIQPYIGPLKLNLITPQMVKRVLTNMATLGRSPQTQLHVFGLMRKMFGDAIENYQYLTFNPVIRKIKPSVPLIETKRLNLEQIKQLLLHVDGKKYGLAIWLHLYMGLRSGELQGLRWEDVDLVEKRVSIRRVYVQKTRRFRNHPKGRKQHSHSIPEELWQRLSWAYATRSGELVVHSPKGSHFVLPYRWYNNALRSYCRALSLPVVGTHGLRHSTSQIYLSHGASRDDLRELFAHSSLDVTDRYIGSNSSHLEQVSNVIRLFPQKSSMKIVHAAVFEESESRKLLE